MLVVTVRGESMSPALHEGDRLTPEVARALLCLPLLPAQPEGDPFDPRKARNGLREVISQVADARLGEPDGVLEPGDRAVRLRADANETRIWASRRSSVGNT